jgi:hypothetical protein
MVPSLNNAAELRISCNWRKRNWLVGASHQRVNQGLKSMERDEVVRIEPGRPRYLGRETRFTRIANRWRCFLTLPLMENHERF